MLVVMSLLGGVGLFLLGMAMMTDGLKMAAGDALRAILRRWTSSRWRGLASGALVTGVVQSSSAVTIATIGFVNAGLLTLTQAIWVIFGTNVGTTMTGWLIALVGLKLDVGALALPFIGVGMLAQLVTRERPRLGGIGQALAGFGAFFLGVGVLRDAFAELVPMFTADGFGEAGPLQFLIFIGLGALLTVLTQSSSAAIALALTANAGGGVPLVLSAAAIIGANIGTTSTALLAAIGATPAARRVAGAHIVFNLCAGVVAIAVLWVLLPLSDGIADALDPDGGDTVTLAVFHTVFNVLGVIVIWPLAGMLVRRLNGMFVTADETLGQPRHLDATLAEVPALAVRGLVLELIRMGEAVFDLARQRLRGAARTHHDSAAQAGVLALGQAVRDFIARLNRNPLPEETVTALPDLIRAVQHFEDAATESAAMEPLPVLPDDLSFAVLEAGVMRSLEMWSGMHEDFPTHFAVVSGEVEGAFQTLKKALLDAAAHGRVKVGVMEAALMRARRMRRVSDAALKAQRRMSPWLALANGVEDASGHEAA